MIPRRTASAGHHDYFRAVTKPGDVVVEFGFETGTSAKVFLEAGAVVHSYDLDDRYGAAAIMKGDYYPFFHFHAGNIRALQDIPDCDILFIDSEHTAEQITFELGFAHRVRRLILMHDTVTCGTEDWIGNNPQNRRPGGILGPIRHFLEAHPEWRVVADFKHSHGLMVLSRT